MSNRSLAEQFLEESAEKEKEHGFYIIVYDFLGEKASPKFWDNLNKLKQISSIRSIQYSVLSAECSKDAEAAALLASHYGAEVRKYRCEALGG
jgi:hypothetical protein